MKRSLKLNSGISVDIPPRPVPGGGDPAQTIDEGRLRAVEVEVKAWLLQQAIESLRARKPVEAMAADFLADALEKCLQDPTKAGRALGLISRKRGRPVTVDKGQRFRQEALCAALVKIARQKNPMLKLTLNPKRAEDRSAFTLVAKSMKVSPSSVHVAWKNRNKRRGSRKTV